MIYNNLCINQFVGLDKFQYIENNMFSKSIGRQKYFIFFIIIISIASGYAIQGNWSVLSVGDMSLVNQNITLQISDYIFRKNTINQKLVFRGCKQFALQSSIEQNQIFFNTNSYLEESLKDRTCQKSNPLDVIFKNLKIVFYFQISIDKLFFNDPFGRNIIVLKRIINAIPINITGVWTLAQYANTRTSLSAQINPNQLIFCQGNSVYNYSLDSKLHLIQLIPIISNCPSTDLINTLQSSKYFRFRNGIINLFNQNVTLTVQLIFSQPYDPNKPIFGIPSFDNMKNSSSNQISPSNIEGIWQIKSLFKIPLKTSKYSLQFTKNNLKLNGGCAKSQFVYQLDPSKQIITLKENKKNNTNNSKCLQSDDQLYINGIMKMYKYLLNSNNGTQILNFYDQNGQIGYSLAIEPKDNPSPSKTVSNSAPKANQITQSSAKTNVAFSPGKYLMLLLQRRDLPRVPIMISEKTITYKRCNDIVQTFQIEKPNSLNSKINVKGGPVTKNKCTPDTDQIYYGTLNLVKSFTYDSGADVIILQNNGGIETISISKV